MLAEFTDNSVFFDISNIRVIEGHNISISKNYTTVNCATGEVGGAIEGHLECLADISVYTNDKRPIDFSDVKIVITGLEANTIWLSNITKTNINDVLYNYIRRQVYECSVINDMFKFQKGYFTGPEGSRTKISKELQCAYITTEDKSFIETVITLFADFTTCTTTLIQCAKRDLILYGDIISESEGGYELTKDGNNVIISTECADAYAILSASDIQEKSIEELESSVCYQLSQTINQ
jgi:hypothetical protein